MRNGVERDQARERGKSAQQHRIGHRAAQMFHRDFSRRDVGQAFMAEALGDVTDTELGKTARAVDQYVTVRNHRGAIPGIHRPDAARWDPG